MPSIVTKLGFAGEHPGVHGNVMIAMKAISRESSDELIMTEPEHWEIQLTIPLGTKPYGLQKNFNPQR